MKIQNSVIYNKYFYQGKRNSFAHNSTTSDSFSINFGVAFLKGEQLYRSDERIFRRVKSSKSEQTRECEDELNEKRNAVKHSFDTKRIIEPIGKINEPVSIAKRNVIKENSRLQAQCRDTKLNSNCADNTKNISFSGKFLSSLFPGKTIMTEPVIINDNGTKDKYIFELAQGLSQFTWKPIQTSNLQSIVTPSELKQLLPQLNKENFISSKQNQEKGIYFIDLDYHSSYSNGQENIFDILENIAKFSNKYYKQTGKDFIFALTDRDTVEGVKHAIRIINDNPEKFKHLKFVPAVKLTFAHEAPGSFIGYENSEMLVYGINPFSENFSTFLQNIIKGRRNTIINFIKKVTQLYPEFGYTVIEFAEQNRHKYNKDFTVSNLYWRAREYVETKGDLAIGRNYMTPKDVLEESEDIFNNLYVINKGSNDSEFSAIDSDIIKGKELNKTIKSIFEEYSTHYDEEKGKVVSAAENPFDDLIDCLSKESQHPIIAICAPFYLSHYYDEKDSHEFPRVINFINTLQETSKRMLTAFETVVPSYDLDTGIDRTQIETFNDYVKKHTNLFEVGGSFYKRFK